MRRPYSAAAASVAASAPRHGSDLRRGLEQLGGLVADHLQVALLRHVRVVHVEQLQHLAFGDDVGGIGQDLHDAHAVGLHHHLEGARVEEVAHQHAGCVAERRVGGLAAAAQLGFVDHVVVQERGGMDELDHRR